jgi:predicted tellurium resistance membrane protein TerC
LPRKNLIFAVDSIPAIFAIVLMFVGVKMMLIDLFKIPVLISLGVVATIIATSIILSLRKGTRERLAVSTTSATDVRRS